MYIVQSVHIQYIVYTSLYTLDWSIVYTVHWYHTWCKPQLTWHVTTQTLATCVHVQSVHIQYIVYTSLYTQHWSIVYTVHWYHTWHVTTQTLAQYIRLLCTHWVTLSFAFKL